ncbi:MULTISPECIES: hypothetical protein [Moorena]|nr:hypothetical protein [Moorena sp. SIO4G3]NEO82063.1 hypothetical protein [Moorena sp. SIO4G3]
MVETTGEENKKQIWVIKALGITASGVVVIVIVVAIIVDKIIYKCLYPFP